MPTAIYLVLGVIWKSVNTSGTIAVTNIFLPFFSWLECIFIAIFSGATCVVTWGCRHSYILHFIIYTIILHFTILFSNPYVHSFARGTIGNVTTHILEFKPSVLSIQSNCTFKSDDSYMMLFGCRTNIVGGLCIMVQPSDVIHTRRDERNRTTFILHQTGAYKTKWNQCPAPNFDFNFADSDYLLLFLFVAPHPGVTIKRMTKVRLNINTPPVSTHLLDVSEDAGVAEHKPRSSCHCRIRPFSQAKGTIFSIARQRQPTFWHLASQ